MIFKKYLVGMFLFIGQISVAQKSADTLAIIKEFSKVMEFAVRPSLYYSSITSMRSIPAIIPADSGRVLHNIFYKLNNDLYYGNEQEEVYLQDSLMITINHSRKSIMVATVDMDSKAKMDLLPLKNLDIRNMLRNHYLISKKNGGLDSINILIQSPDKRSTQGISISEMKLCYGATNNEPYGIEIIFHMQQPPSEQIVAMLARQGVDAQKLVIKKDGLQYLVFTQVISIRFLEMQSTKEKAVQMPSWKTKVEFDATEETFKGKGEYVGYEVTKTF